MLVYFGRDFRWLEVLCFWGYFREFFSGCMRVLVYFCGNFIDMSFFCISVSFFSVSMRVLVFFLWEFYRHDFFWYFCEVFLFVWERWCFSVGILKTGIYFFLYFCEIISVCMKAFIFLNGNCKLFFRFMYEIFLFL